MKSLFFLILINCLWSVLVCAFHQISCEKQWSKISTKEQIVTFVIPTSGRLTLARTINSLYNQTDPRWLAVIMMDGVSTSLEYLNPRNNFPLFISGIDIDSRVCIQHTEKMGVSNCAGGLRNYAVQFSITPWLAFVDDDDTVGERFVEAVAKESSGNVFLDCIIFRMSSVGTVHPQLEFDNFYINDVGISFAVKRDIFFRRNIYFESSNAEDFLFLDRLRREGYSILLSEDILYYVKDIRPPVGMLGTRSMIRPIDKFMIWDFNHKILVDGTLQNALGSNCSSRALNFKEYPNFIFTEEHNIFFSRNIRGLKHSLAQALLRGCLGHWRYGPVNISIVFTATHFVDAQYYIQVQLEQQGTHHFSPSYIQKLQRASQVWEFVPVTHSSKRMFYTPTYFVPTVLMLDQNVYSCRAESSSSLSNLRGGAFEVFERGFYRTCVIADGQISDGPIRKSPYCTYCQEDEATLASLSCAKLLKNRADILMFGKIEGSYNNYREKVCLDMRTQNLSSLCLQGVFGEALNHFVCQAKIIVVERYFKNSVLETHRIDPLLQAGKVIISSHSSNRLLESFYSPVVFTSRSNFVQTIGEVSHDIEEWKIANQYHNKIESFLAAKRANVDPLCYALRNLEVRDPFVEEKWWMRRRKDGSLFFPFYKSPKS